MKCPECLGNNAFEVIPEEDTEERDDLIEVECYDCGHMWTETIEQAINTVEDEGDVDEDIDEEFDEWGDEQWDEGE